MTSLARLGRVLEFPSDIPVRAREASLMDAGFFTALALAAALAAGHTLELAEDGKGSLVLGLLLVSAGLHAAMLKPGRIPLLLVAYLPFSLVFGFVTDVSGLNMINLLLGLALVGLFVNRVTNGPAPPLEGFDYTLLVYAAFGFIGMLNALGVVTDGDYFAVLLDYKRWNTPILVYFMTRALVRSRQDAGRVLWVIVLTGFMVALITWREGIDLRDRGSIEASRAEGILQQSNSMGAFLAYYGVPLLALAVRWPNWGARAVAGIAYLTAVRTVIFTFSRGAFGAVAGGTLVTLLLANPLYLLAAAGAGGGVLAAGYMPKSVADRLDDTQGEDQIYDESVGGSLDQSSAHRLMLWRAGWEIMKRHPFTGVGLGAFSKVVGDYTEVSLRSDDPTDAHNAYILTAAELGLPALALMVALLVWLGMRGLLVYWHHRDPRDRSLALALLGSLTAVIVSCLFGSRFAEESLVGNFWVLAGVLSAVHARGRRYGDGPW